MDIFHPKLRPFYSIPVADCGAESVDQIIHTVELSRVTFGVPPLPGVETTTIRKIRKAAFAHHILCSPHGMVASIHMIPLH